MVKSVRILNWVIGGYIAIRIFGYWKIAKPGPGLQIFFALVPIFLLVWQALVLRQRFQDVPEDSASAPYRRVDTGDWRRVFWILCFGHTPLASQYVWGFFLFSGIAAVLLIALVFTASVELYRRRAVTRLLIGCLGFTCFLLAWEKNTYVIHYGVPIIGHFLEKPEYNAKYRVEIGATYSSMKNQAIADIHVGGRTETEDFDDGAGWPVRFFTSRTYAYRDVWIRRLYFPNGGSADICNQRWPLHVGDHVSVTDSHGTSWYVRLLDEPVP